MQQAGKQGCRKRKKKGQRIWSQALQPTKTLQQSAAFWEVTSVSMLLIAPPHHSHQIIRLFSLQVQSSWCCRFFPFLSSSLTAIRLFLLGCSLPLAHTFSAASIPPSVVLGFAAFPPLHLAASSALRFPLFSFPLPPFLPPLSVSLSLASLVALLSYSVASPNQILFAIAHHVATHDSHE